MRCIEKVCEPPIYSIMFSLRRSATRKDVLIGETGDPGVDALHPVAEDQGVQRELATPMEFQEQSAQEIHLDLSHAKRIDAQVACLRFLVDFHQSSTFNKITIKSFCQKSFEAIKRYLKKKVDLYEV